MVGFKVTTKVLEYRLVLAVSVPTKVEIVHGQTIDQARHALLARISRETNFYKRRSYEMILALLQWGTKKKAELKNMSEKNEKIHVSLAFKEKSNMQDFIKYLNAEVENAIIVDHQVVIEIPMTAKVSFENLDIEQIEESFAKRCNSTRNRGHQEEYERAQRLFKLGKTCYAAIVRVLKEGSRMSVTFGFEKDASLAKFIKDIPTNVA